MDISELTNIPVDMKTGIDIMPVYAVIGIIVIAQFGTILTVMIWLMKGVWWASQKNTEVEQLKKDVNSAFTKIRETHEKEIINGSRGDDA